MVYFVWLLSIVIAFEIGYFFRRITWRIDVLENKVKEKVDKKPELVEPQSNLIDLDDPIQTAQYEHQKMMRELNEQSDN